MDWLAELLTTHLILFTLVLARVGGLVITAPLFAALAVPKNVRAMIAFAPLPCWLHRRRLIYPPPRRPASIEWVLALAVELLLGLALGLGTAILVAEAQLAGQLIAQLSGLSLSRSLRPELGGRGSTLLAALGLYGGGLFADRRPPLGCWQDYCRFVPRLPVERAHLPPALPQTLRLVDDRKLFFEGHPRRRARPGGAVLVTVILGLLSRT